MRRIANTIGIDDAPFDRAHRGDVPIVGAVFCGHRGDGPIVGAVFCGHRMDGVLRSKVRRDGRNATERVAEMVLGSSFEGHIQAVLLQGIALAGFNVIDLFALHELLGRPVLVVARKAPDLASIRRALYTRVPGGARRQRLIEAAGPMEPCAGVWVQRAGLDLRRAASLIEATRVQGKIPEPLRAAHLIAGAMVTGRSRGRA